MLREALYKLIAMYIYLLLQRFIQHLFNGNYSEALKYTHGCPEWVATCKGAFALSWILEIFY